jgi:hypothetical protein
VSSSIPKLDQLDRYELLSELRNIGAEGKQHPEDKKKTINIEHTSIVLEYNINHQFHPGPELLSANDKSNMKYFNFGDM